MSRQPPPDVIAAAQKADGLWGVPASISLAQWALESGWGAHMPAGSNNPFGIKAVAGQPHVDVLTWEFLHGQHVKIAQPFRKFVSIAEAFDAHARLLATSPHYALARQAGKDARGWAHGLQGHYATDPHYASELIDVMGGSNLYQWDRIA